MGPLPLSYQATGVFSHQTSAVNSWHSLLAQTSKKFYRVIFKNIYSIYIYSIYSIYIYIVYIVYIVYIYIYVF